MISVTTDGPFQNIGDAQGVGDLTQIAFAVSSILHDRGATDDFELSNLGEIIEDLILYAVGKVTIVFVLAEAFER
jgi:hypothetical protein